MLPGADSFIKHGKALSFACRRTCPTTHMTDTTSVAFPINYSTVPQISQKRNLPDHYADYRWDNRKNKSPDDGEITTPLFVPSSVGVP